MNIDAFILGLGGKYLDHGFYQVPASVARDLCGGELPGPGRERLVNVEDGSRAVWVARTPVDRGMVWSVRDAGSWRIENGRMVLRTR